MTPKRWPEKRLGSVLQKVTEPVDLEPDRLYQEIGIRSHGKGIFYKEPSLGSAIGDKRVFWVQPDTLVLNIIFAWEQAVARTTERDRGLIASHRFPMFQSIENQCDIDYLLYFFKTKRGKSLLELASPGGAGRNKTLGQQEFFNIRVPLPPIGEQKAIAKAIATWDKSIEVMEGLIRNSKGQKKALMQKLLIGRQSHSKSSQQDWPIITLGKVADFAAGATPSTKKPEFWGGDIPWMSSGEINQRQIHDVEGRITDLGLKNSSTKLIPKNSVLIALAGQGSTRGKVGINRIDLSTNQSIAAIIPDQSRLDFEFLFYYLDYRYQELRALSSGDGGRGGLSLRILRQIKVFLPPMEEQKAIAVLLNCADKQIDTQMRAAERLAVEKSCLMQQLMTGKRRVKLDAPSAIPAAA